MVIGHLFYIRSVLKGATVPNKATWLIIAFTTYVFLANQLASEINSAIWGMALPATTITAIAIVSLKYGVSSVNKFDVVVVFVALAGLAAWWLLEDPRASIIATAITSIVSVVPTVNKLRGHPGSENTTNWVMAAISMVVMVFAVEPEFDFLLVPSIWIVLNFTIAYLNTREHVQTQLEGTG